MLIDTKILFNDCTCSEAEPSVELPIMSSSIPTSSPNGVTPSVLEGEEVSEAIFPASVEVNDESSGVTFDRTVAVVDGHPIIVATERISVEIHRKEVSVIFDGTDLIVNGDAVHVSQTVGGGAASIFVGGESI